MSRQRGWRAGSAGIAFRGRTRAADDAAIHLGIQRLAVADATGSGVRVHDVGRVELSRVQVEAAGEHGIRQQNTQGPVVVRERVVRQAAKNGIALSHGQDAQVLRNQVQMAGQLGQQATLGMDFNGVRISGFPVVQVVDNTIEGTGDAGIMVSESGEERLRARSTVEVHANRISASAGSSTTAGDLRQRPDTGGDGDAAGAGAAQGRRRQPARAAPGQPGRPGDAVAAEAAGAGRLRAHGGSNLPRSRRERLRHPQLTVPVPPKR